MEHEGPGNVGYLGVYNHKMLRSTNASAQKRYPFLLKWRSEAQAIIDVVVLGASGESLKNVSSPDNGIPTRRAIGDENRPAA